MEDKELLTLAAKAAGYTLEDHYDVNGEYYPWVFELEDRWQPLALDKDALRLAVKLGITAAPGNNTELARSRFSVAVYGAGEILEKRGDDPYAATRRAIVRAAAEVGRGMG
jgi:hypothetical protein